MPGSKAFAHDAYGFLRVLRSRNPKNIRNPLIFEKPEQIDEEILNLSEEI